MARKNSNGMVEIPEVTLNALKGLLFNSDKGVDLSPIINDLSLGEDNDLIAINVGLAFKGLTPKIDQSDKFDYCCSSYYVRYRFQGFSLITGTVRTERTYIYYENGEFIEKEGHEDCMDYARWIGYSCSEEEVRQRLLKRNKEEK